MLALVSFVFASLLAATPVPTGPVRLEPVARDLVVNFTAGRFAAATREFNANLATIVTPEVLEGQKKAIEAQVGAFQAIRTLRQFQHEEFRVVEVTCQYEKAQVAFQVVFDKDNRIGAVHMNPVGATKVDPVLEALAREFHADFTAKRFGPATKAFNPTMRAQLPVTKLASLERTVATTFGAFQSIDRVTQESDDQLRAVALITTYEKSSVEVRVVFDRDGKIGGIRVGPRSEAAE
jgi:hypothetical protein